MTSFNLAKSHDFFQPEKLDERIHIIGCGSVGSTIAENLARCGITKMTLWDFDIVESHNVVNQMYTQKHLNMKKVDALADILQEINPDITDDLKLKPEGWNGNQLSGYIFLCVDSIEIRREIVEKHFNNLTVKGVFDFRTLLESAQHYAADWSNVRQKDNLLASMQFSHDEATEEAPVSACGYILGVATTVRCVSSIGVANFIAFVKGKGLKTFIQVDLEHFVLDAF